MGLIIAIVCIGGGLCLLAPLVGQILKTDKEAPGNDTWDQAEVIIGSPAELSAL
jgi:hypothetical protein